jgi:hypothetical protein
MRTQRALAIALALSAGGVLSAQVGRGGSEWLTAHADAQRTSWIRGDALISVDSMSKPGFELQWKTRVDNQPRLANGLTQGVTANGVTLFVPMSVVAGSSNNVFALDNDTGYVVWQRHFDAALPAATAACPGGITAAGTRIVGLVPPPPPGPGRSGPRGGAGYHSAVGEPGAGVPVETRGGGPGRAAAPAARGGAAPAGGRGAARAGAPPPGAGFGRGNQAAANAGIPGAPGGGGPGGGYGRPSGVAYAVTSDGMLHVLGLPSGKDIQKPAPFLPANARWSDTIAVNTTLYAATSHACGGAADGVWAIDLDSENKPVTSWKTNGGSVVGSLAFTEDGTLLAAIGPGRTSGDGRANAIVALDAKTLQVKDWFTQPTAEFVTGPTVLRRGDQEIVAAATKDGRILLLDAASLGGASHGTPLFASGPVVGAGASIAADALATWQETDAAPGGEGTRWILVPVAGRPATSASTNGAITTGAVVALKLGGSDAALTLDAGWTSSNLNGPATPIIVNGVVFALATGQSGSRPSPAMLHAYEGVTGKALWNSERTMTAAASAGSFWSATGQAYVGTQDGTIYAFGFLDERR